MSSRNYPTGGRYFSNSINIEKSHPVFLQIFDSTSVSPQGHTGNWRPASPVDFAANIQASGLSVSINSIAITGNPDVRVSNPVTLAGGFAGITGTVSTNIVNPILATSGTSIVTNLVSTTTVVTGLTAVSGLVSINPNSTINAQITGVSNVTGSIFTSYIGSTSVNNSTPSGVAGTILPANSIRKQWFVQNLSTGELYIKLGAGASSISFNYVLKGASTPTSYDGASVTDDGARWRGIVSAAGQAINYICWELT